MLFHRHNFKKDGLNLWCSCGKIKKLDCCHKWKVHNTEDITSSNIYNNLKTEKRIQTLICENCGEIKKIDLYSIDE